MILGQASRIIPTFKYDLVIIKIIIIIIRRIRRRRRRRRKRRRIIIIYIALILKSLSALQIYTEFFLNI